MISNKKSDNKEIKLFGNLLIYHDFMRNYYIFLINILITALNNHVHYTEFDK